MADEIRSLMDDKYALVDNGDTKDRTIVMAISGMIILAINSINVVSTNSTNACVRPAEPIPPMMVSMVHNRGIMTALNVEISL